MHSIVFSGLILLIIMLYLYNSHDVSQYTEILKILCPEKEDYQLFERGFETVKNFNHYFVESNIDAFLLNYKKNLKIYSKKLKSRKKSNKKEKSNENEKRP